MNRRTFIKSAGLFGATIFVPVMPDAFHWKQSSEGLHAGVDLASGPDQTVWCDCIMTKEDLKNETRLLIYNYRTKMFEILRKHNIEL